MRRPLGVTLIVGLFALAACTPAAPVGDEPPGPVPSSTSPVSVTPSATAPASVRPTKSSSASTQPADDESEEEQGDEASEPTVSFKDAYTYPDGVKVEVTKIEHGTITAGKRQGEPWVQLTVRVKNGSKHRLGDLIGSFALVYDGDETDPVRVAGVDDSDLSGHISRGASKVCSSTYSVPLKYQDHVFLEFTADIDHGSILFSGSIA